MEKVAIVGNGDYAKMLYRYINLDKCYEVTAFVVEKNYIAEKEIYEKPVYPIEEIEEYISKDIKLILGIGYRNMGNIKKRLFEELKSRGYSFSNYIHPTAIISQNVLIGMGNNIFENTLIQEGVEIGDGNLIYGNSVVGHESSIGNYNTLSLSVNIAGCVKVKNNCFLGVSSSVKDHVTINDYALIGAATYCSKDLEEYQVLVSPKAYVLEGKISTDFI